jgi:hypothetical protein
VIGQPVSLQDSVDVRDGVFVGEVRWTPLGDVPTDESPWGYGDVPGRFGVAISGYYGRLVRNVERYDSLTTGLSALAQGLVREGAVTADAIWAWNRLSGAAEFTVGWLQGLMPVAGPWLPGIEATAQVGVFVWAHVLQLAARFSYLDPDLSVTRNEFVAVEGQLGAYVIASHLAVKLRYAAGHEGSTNIVGVPTGWTHLLTLQAQFFF